MKYLFACCLGFITFCSMASAATEQHNKTVIVTIDGLRWQEAFYGAQLSLIENTEFVSDIAKTKQQFWSDDLQERQSKLMPFFHKVLMTQGSVIGDREKGSYMRVENPQYFSYPGYNEIFTGRVDRNIRSNQKLANPNVTFLEWLNQQDKYKDQIAIFSGWDVFPYIYNTERSGLKVNAGFAPFNFELANEYQAEIATLNRLQAEIPSPWATVRHDAFTFNFARIYLEAEQPEVLVINLGETDDFAHNGKYDAYLSSARQTDRYIEQLWNLLQSLPAYKNNTNLVLITDHGRGADADDWQHHASQQAVQEYMQNLAHFKQGIVGAEQIWFAGIGPQIAPQGLITASESFTQSQFAATVLSLMGLAPDQYSPDIAAPIKEVLKADVLNKQTSILFGSCSHQDKEMPIFDAILQENMDAFVFLGDNIYGDTEDMAVLSEKYQKLASQKWFKPLMDKTQVLAVWDDHDYGENDAGKNYPMKQASKNIMLDFWQVPQDSPRRAREDGLYGSYVLGEGEHAVRIILPDLRYMRDDLQSVARERYVKERAPKNMGPYDKSSGSMLGDAQWRWLEQMLLTPEPIKIIASSLQLVSEFTGWEAWTNYEDRARLMQLIKQHGVNGVMVISGDTHWGEIARDNNSVDYPIWDITSSGLTEEWKQVSPNQHRVSVATSEANYGFINIQWQQDPLIHIGLKDVKGDVVADRHISLSSISPYCAGRLCQ